uniref:F-box domain-containing protein n=1 Tax=Caenorhabditis tropicalis TaxID=1561998 RepID=A0A1I7UBN0_9PELO
MTMSKFIENHPSAIEVFLFYEREKDDRDLYEKLCEVTRNGVSEEDFKKVFEKAKTKNVKSKRKEIRQLVASNQSNLRLCILSDVIDKKSITESVLRITEIIESKDIDRHDFEFWFNRFTSGNWNLDQMTFSDLPPLLVSNIAEELDFPSQMKLRKVSRDLQNIVDQVRPSIDRIRFNMEPWSSQGTLRVAIQKFKESAGIWEFHFDGDDNWKIAFDAMKILLGNPKLRLERLTWENKTSSEIDFPFIEMIKSLNHKIRIVSLHAELDGNSMTDLLKAIMPGTLESIDIYNDYEPNDIKRFAELEQWKQAKSVHFWEYISDFSSYLHHLQHFESVSGNVDSVSMDDILFVKKLFIQNKPLKRFDVCTEKKPSKSKIVETLGLSEFDSDAKEKYFVGRNDIPETNEYLEVTLATIEIQFNRKTSD